MSFLSRARSLAKPDHLPFDLAHGCKRIVLGLYARFA
jgi:hypothetical protein